MRLGPLLDAGKIHQVRKLKKEGMAVKASCCVSSSFLHLSSGLDSLPDAEVTDEPDDGQTQSQLPADRAQLV